MNSIKFLFCGCLVSLLGCAGSTSTAERGADAEAIRAKASQAYNEQDSGSAVKNVPETTLSHPQVGTAEESHVSLAGMLNPYVCPNADDLRGQGIADDPNSALVIAQKDIAAKIQSVVVAKTDETRKSNVDAFGRETIESSFEANTQVFTQLRNAQDAKPVATLTGAGKYGVVACMSKSDAAKPFLNEANLLQDSVTLALKIFEEQKHPVIKNNAFKAAQEMYARMQLDVALLAGLGVNFENKVKGALDLGQQNYNAFRAQYAFYYKVDDFDQSVQQQRRAVFERLSVKYPVRAAECVNGLLLKLDVSPVACSEGSLGISCTTDLYLTGSNCDGEDYFSLHAKVKGSGRYDVNEAKNRLNDNISRGDWFNEWTQELDKWRLE